MDSKLWLTIVRNQTIILSDGTKSDLWEAFMERYAKNIIHKINYLTTEMNGLYHQFSQKLGISDSVSIVLYSIYDAGGECLLGDIQKNSGISKQTIHSAVQGLIKEGILYLEQYNGKAKKVFFTPKGREYAEKTVARIYEAEINSFSRWPEEKVEEYLKLMEEYAESFRQEMEKI